MAAPAILMAASGAAKTVGGIVSGMSAASAADAQAKLDRGNAVLAADQAGQREEALRRQGRQQLGEQVAGLAENGAGFTQTARDLMNQSAANLSMDALNARYDGTLQANNFMNQAKADRAKAHAGRISTWIGAGTNLLGGLSGYLNAGGTLPSLGKPPVPGPDLSGLDSIGPVGPANVADDFSISSF